MIERNENIKLSIIEPSVLEKDFFILSEQVNPVVQKVAEVLKKENSKFRFISKVIQKFGMPLWEKAIIRSSHNSYAENAQESNHENHNESNSYNVLIPVAQQNSTEVNAVYICQIIEDSVSIRFYSKANYSQYGYVNNSLLNAERVAGLIMYVQNKVFGTTSFVVNDNKLFRNLNSTDTVKPRIMHFKNLDSSSDNQTSVSSEDYAEVTI